MLTLITATTAVLMRWQGDRELAESLVDATGFALFLDFLISVALIAGAAQYLGL